MSRDFTPNDWFRPNLEGRQHDDDRGVNGIIANNKVSEDRTCDSRNH